MGGQKGKRRVGGSNKEGWISSLIKFHVETNLLDHIF